MPHPTISTKVHQALDIHCDVTAQVTFNSNLLDLSAQAIDLAIGQVLDPGRRIDARITAN